MRLTLLAILPLLAACAMTVPEPPAAAVSLSDALTPGVSWRVERVGQRPPPAGATPGLIRKGESVTGDSGCNRFFGTVQTRGGISRITEVGATEMACAPARMAFETAMLTALTRADGAVVAGERVTLTEGGRPVIVLVRQPGRAG